MSWRVVLRPEVEGDVAEAAGWYEERHKGLGAMFVEEVITVWDELAENPLLNSRRDQAKNVRWRYPKRFPYRIVYEVFDEERVVVVAAVLHATRADRHWRARV
ncbi:hypothetical protein CMV30_11555 [Nibricoccus aquaticus]|uniref:Type II toxin-antitoxin system RelE/ParE family toxin n=1 Tax=Nibricoccus aquaticus TaxID=2576891 RepID=A0A290QGS6_9BACT|nr:type II toxin-antitoxin system RelE/ParE family toxin [Nibricoccus aquaticus]ATC64538.1 hypothetical protein CMV30_11555 [Nibricoccus aquaticus]